MELHYYQSKAGKNLILEYIDSLPVDKQTTVDSSNVYLLHACRKQKNKTEKKDRKIVESRAKELGKAIGKSFI